MNANRIRYVDQSVIDKAVVRSTSNAGGYPYKEGQESAFTTPDITLSVNVSDKGGISIDGNLDISFTVERNSKGDSRLMDHERKHEEIFGRNWNEFAENLNSLDGRTLQMSDSAKNRFSRYFEHSNDHLNKYTGKENRLEERYHRGDITKEEYEKQKEEINNSKENSQEKLNEEREDLEEDLEPETEDDEGDSGGGTGDDE